MSAVALKRKEAEAIVLLTTYGNDAYRIVLTAMMVANNRGNPMEMMEHMQTAHYLLQLPGPELLLPAQVEKLRAALVESTAEINALRARVETLEKPKAKRRRRTARSSP